jgi:hypothetical protein
MMRRRDYGGEENAPERMDGMERKGGRRSERSPTGKRSRV